MKKNQSTLLQTWGYSSKKTNNDTNNKEFVNVQNVVKKVNTAKSANGGIVDLLDGLDDQFEDDIVLDENVDEDIYLERAFKTNAAHEKIKGFDESFGKIYIYPTNYPVRDYQFNIIQVALMKNTLVVLPTGLGKTFIAAVVMYNFYRWYPQGKLIFMAPTKPLVAQQIEACYKIMGIPQKDTIEMTGAMSPQKREVLWKTKRVFFLTPQVLQNDLGRGSCIASDVICLVFDEAHRALGNHAYCQVTKDIMRYQTHFRVLALSATPGDDMKAVQQVIDNLLISNIEIRSEDSIDIQKYVHERKVEKIVVAMSNELKKTRSIFIKILGAIVLRLHSKKALWVNDPERVSKFLLLKAREQWRANNHATNDRSQIGFIEGDFALLISLYHALELLQQHGILSFYNFLKGILAGTKGTARGRNELMKNEEFMNLMEVFHGKIEPDGLNQSLNESILSEKRLTPKQRLLKSIPKPNSSFVSHPKLTKLEELVVEHFTKYQRENSETPQNTRVMIFSQYRDSVQEITSVLGKHEPLVKAMSFIGQGSKESTNGKANRGLSQKEQIEILRRFRTGGYNTVISTSVGEEGLDIGDVDLIICYDASSSPIRLVQRMGRTGRKRKGRIIILVGEGKEEMIYKKSLTNKNGIHKNLTNAANSLKLYEDNPRMVPKHLNPKCHKMPMTIDLLQPTTVKSKLIKPAIRSCNRQGVLSITENDRLQSVYYGDINNCMKCKQLQLLENKNCNHLQYKYPLSLNEWCEWQTSEQETHKVKHSKCTKKLCRLMSTFDKLKHAKEFEIYESKIKNATAVHRKKKMDNSKNAMGKLWRKSHLQALNQHCSDSSDVDDFESVDKKKDSLSTDDQLKPCSFEKLVSDVSSSLKKKTSKIRLTKLPTIQPKDDVDDISDNQLGFCSQVSMDTLFNRCQKKRRVDSLDFISEEKENMKNSTSKNEIKTLENSFNSPLQTNLNDVQVPRESNIPDSPDLFPMSALRALPLRRYPPKVCVVSPLMQNMIPKQLTNENSDKLKIVIPEPPLEVDISSFFDNNLSSNDSIIENVNNEISNFTHVKQKENIDLCDSLVDFVENEGESFFSSPPIISQAPIQTMFQNGDQSTTGIQHRDTSDIKGLIDECDSPLFRKPSKSKVGLLHSPPSPDQFTTGIQNRDQYLNKRVGTTGTEGLIDECDSPLYRKPSKRKVGILQSPSSPHQFTTDIQNRDQHLNKRVDTSDTKGLIDECDSPLFRKPSKRKVGILHSPPSALSCDEDVNTVLSETSNIWSTEKRDLRIKRRKTSVNKTARNRSDKCYSAKMFLDDEAEVEGGDSDLENTISDYSYIDGYVKDSFIDDTSQLTPYKNPRQANKKTPVDMHAIYRQSLMSPNNNALQFRTPLFKACRNRFKLANLAEKYNNIDSDESSEAEEVMGLVESDLEQSMSEEQTSDVDQFSFCSKDDVIECDDSFIEKNEGQVKKCCLSYTVDELPPITFSFGVFTSPVKNIVLENNASKGETSICKLQNNNGNYALKGETSICKLQNNNGSYALKGETSMCKLQNNVSSTASKDATKLDGPSIEPGISKKNMLYVDSRCVANSQIASLLRANENCIVKVKPQLGCDYVLSKRCGVRRKMVSEISNGAKLRKTVECVRVLCEMFSKSYLIIEKDRVKTKNVQQKSSSQLTKYYSGMLTKLSVTDATVLFSNSENDTAVLLGNLATLEGEAGHAIHQFNDNLTNQQNQMLSSMLCIPNLTYPVAMEIAKMYRNIGNILRSTLQDFSSKLKHATSPKVAAETYFFFQRRFDANLLGGNN